MSLVWDTQDTYSDIDKFLLSTNKVNANSLSDLEYKERIITQLAMQELSKNEIKGDFDYNHLKQIHKFIFKDVYTWAGKDRYEEKFFKALHKGDSQFCVGVLIPQESKRIFDGLMEKELLKSGFGGLNSAFKDADFSLLNDEKDRLEFLIKNCIK
ncbi:hypothetical protein [Campylobacter upsaliensis]|uniref:hypothetical protein n=1 Tax=Campylobacter upsaliensis TaxID=28080 RepID=UPI0006976674|nr:hypothetical protein [Campylobacter upsaliensis]MCR2110007.1 hypothetical protein [Campylobacter upsaliensis]MCR2113747.1 hypothetical protein [Campylobacter upsaliensis]MCR2115744.1 hypothetical protein [Campylobacter upsaliensis]MCR2120795.1 hypothetical protein [Campylobacter upsaliensis]